MKYLILTILLTLPLLANAGVIDRVGLNLTSHHFDDKYNYNRENLGFALIKDINYLWQAEIGTYNNSYNKDSNYVAAILRHEQKYWGFGVKFLIVTGYDDIAAPESELKRREREYHDKDNEYDVRSKDEVSKDVENMNEYQFVVLPTGFVKYNQHSLHLGVIPALTKKGVGLLTLQYQYKL